MIVDLKDKTYLVTGGSRGIGKAIVEKLVESGASVVFTYKSSEAQANALAESLQKNAKGKVLAIKADISQAAEADILIENIQEKIGDIDGLINNAGITQDKPFFQMDANSWEAVINTNLSGTYYITKALLNKLIRRDNGKIINMASVSGLRGSMGQANYSASKAAIMSLTKTLSLELARFNVQVNAIAPGFIETEMVENMDPNAKKAIKQMVPARRMGRADEVADAVLYLLSPSSNYITGHTLVIDGGLTA